MISFRDILKELGKSDDQGRDWYGWATNQTAHAFVGVGLAVITGSIAAVVAISCIKEAGDVFRSLSVRTVRDSLVDIAFVLLGAGVVLCTPYSELMVVLVAMGLLIGIVPRARLALGGKK